MYGKSIDTLSEQERANLSRPFFIEPAIDSMHDTYGAMDFEEPFLSSHAGLIAKRAQHLGSPHMVLSNVEGLDYCSIATDAEANRVMPEWWITARSEEQNIVLHGTIGFSHTRWNLLRKDNQGRLYFKDAVLDMPGEINSFVLTAIAKTNLHKKSAIMLDAKEAVRKKHNECVYDNIEALIKYGGRNSEAKRLLGIYHTLSFPRLNSHSSDKIIFPPHYDRRSCKRVELPTWLQKAMHDQDFEAEVLTKMPKGPQKIEELDSEAQPPAQTTATAA